MSHVLDRIGAFFLDPPPAEAAAPSASGRPPGRATGPGAAAPPAGTAEPSAPREAVLWRGGDSPHQPALPRGAAPPSKAAPREAVLWRGAAPPRQAHAWPVGAATRHASPPAGAPANETAAPADATPTRFVPPVQSAGPASTSTPAAAFAVVFGAPALAVPLAAAVAGELRAQARAAAAVVCVWSAPVPPAGASTPAVRRLAARHVAHGAEATACGRLVWLRLDPDADAAATQGSRVLSGSVAPVVLAAAGPRPAAFEPLLQDADLAIAVLPADADEALRTLALATLPTRAALLLPPLPPGPPRWAAMAGLARLRSLRQVRP